MFAIRFLCGKIKVRKEIARRKPFVMWAKTVATPYNTEREGVVMKYKNHLIIRVPEVNFTYDESGDFVKSSSDIYVVSDLLGNYIDDFTTQQEAKNYVTRSVLKSRSINERAKLGISIKAMMESIKKEQ